jgi:hypothetical protein
VPMTASACLDKNVSTAFPLWLIRSLWSETSLAGWKRECRALVGLRPMAALGLNEEIRCNCADLGLRFLEICIDGDAEQSARKIGGFLGVDGGGSLLRLNGSAVHR